MCQEKLDKYSQVLSLSVCEQECVWELEREEMNVGIFVVVAQTRYITFRAWPSEPSPAGGVI